nr:MAG TPA: hypothetical protein [Caudoviricetes sp.]
MYTIYVHCFISVNFFTQEGRANNPAFLVAKKSSTFSNIFGFTACVLPGNMLYLTCK